MAHDVTLPGSLDARDAARITRTTAMLSVGVAGILLGLKLWAWLASGSVAMLSSMADSGLDLAASAFTLAAVTYAAMPPDAEHRFGHGKAEGVAALVQAALVAISGTLVGIEAVRRLFDPEPIQRSALAVAVMCVSIAMTVALVWAQTRALKKTGSVATEGDRAHYLADLGANAVVIVGILGASVLGWLWLDPVVGLLVAAWLLHGAIDVAGKGANQLLDRELSDTARDQIAALAVDGEGILAVHDLRTRASGPYVHIQFHAEMPNHLSLAAAHTEMVKAEHRIREAFPGADILIHPDPRGVAEPHGHELFLTDSHDDADTSETA